jgi:hypothetical protein
MARDLFGVEIGVSIFEENGANLSNIISGTASPDGVSGAQGASPIGSLYLRSGTSQLFQKTANIGAAGDWTIFLSGMGKWRREKLTAVTNDTVSVGSRNLSTTPFADDQAPLLTAADFVAGDFIIADADNTPVLLEVTAVSSPSITLAAAQFALVAEDTFVCINYLPDVAGGENRAVVNYNGSIVVKIADIDWSIATGINLSSGYVAASGNVAANDTVEAAIAKLDGVNDNQDTLSGVAQGSTDLGSWTSPVDLLFSATSTVKALFQRIGVLLMQLRGVQTASFTTAITADSVPVADVLAVKWLVYAYVTGTPANAQAFEVYAMSNGTLVDDTVSSILNVGSTFNLSRVVDISGGDMRLRLSTSGSAVTAIIRRIEVVKTVL